jgi:hypothetical protein
MGIFDVSDLGNYYRVFYTITQFLLTKNRISKAEQSKPSSEDSNRTSGVGSLIDSKSSYLIMIPTIFILLLKLTRLLNMFYMVPHKIAFYRIASHQPHPLLSRRHCTSKRKIYQRYSSKWHRVSSKCSHHKSRRQIMPAPAPTPKQLCWIRWAVHSAAKLAILLLNV